VFRLSGCALAELDLHSENMTRERPATLSRLASCTQTARARAPLDVQSQPHDVKGLAELLADLVQAAALGEPVLLVEREAGFIPR
jgi:hypothetical protein